jgi:hypothetical protein
MKLRSSARLLALSLVVVSGIIIAWGPSGRCPRRRPRARNWNPYLYTSTQWTTRSLYAYQSCAEGDYFRCQLAWCFSLMQFGGMLCLRPDVSRVRGLPKNSGSYVHLSNHYTVAEPRRQ